MDHHKIKYDWRFTKTAFFILISAFLSYSGADAQRVRSEIPPLRERLFFGGNFGLQFGTITDIQVSPIVGLWVFPRLAIAAGADYRFYKDPNYRTDIYGGSTYMQFHFIKDLNSIIPAGIHMGFFLHVEDELLSLESSIKQNPPYTSARFMVNTVLGGGGISQPMGRRSSLDLMFLWVLNNPDYDVYGNPEIRISLIF
jgi:hypothetical protein